MNERKGLDPSMQDVYLEDFVDEFAALLKTQLVGDRERWGDTWRHRIRGGQEQRIFANLDNYFDRFRHGGNPIPWLKVAGLALIAWVRESHPETLFSEEPQA